MNHIKIFSAAVVAVLLCSGMKAAQSELPCGVTLFFDYKVAETNSVKTGRPGLLSGSTNWYRTDEEIITQSFNLPSIHWGSFNSTYRANYPSVHHFGGSGCPPPPGVEGSTTVANVSYEVVSPPPDCSASSTNGVWSDNMTCYNQYDPWADNYHSHLFNEVEDPPATDSTDEYHVFRSEPGVFYDYRTTRTLGNLYTTAELIKNAMGALTWPDEWSNGGESAKVTKLTTDGRCVKVRGLRYRLRYLGPKGESGTFRWIERFKPNDGGAFIDTVKEHHVQSFTGVEQTSPEFVIDSPPSDGEVWVIPPSGSGGACSRCTLAQADFQNGSASFTFGLGNALFGQSAGLLYVMENYPGAVHTRQALRTSTPRGLIIVLTNSGGLLQVKAPDAFVNVTNITSGYNIDFYSSAGPTNAGTGLFDLPLSSPFASWRVVQVSSSPYSVEVRQTGTATNIYTYESGGWVWTRPDGTTESTTVITNATGDKLHITRTIGSAGGTPVFDQSVSNIVLNPGVVVPVMEILGAGSETMTNRWMYETNVASTHTNYGKLLMKIDATGGWERYEYETNGLMLKRIVGFGNSGTNPPRAKAGSLNTVTLQWPTREATTWLRLRRVLLWRSSKVTRSHARITSIALEPTSQFSAPASTLW